MTEANASRSVAGRLAAVATGVLGEELPVRLRAWDGSEAGPVGGPVLVLRNRRAVRRLWWSPAGSGLADAYIAGEIDIEGDLAQAMSALCPAGSGTDSQLHLSATQRLQLAAAARWAMLGHRPPAPGSVAPKQTGHHGGDWAPVTRQDDLSFQQLLDPSMSSSCGYFAAGPAGGLAAAQQSKLDLICRKLGLTAGDRHLDVGCGWGSLICYAAERYGTLSTGITLSRQNYEYVSKRVAEAGLADRVDVRLADRREWVSGAGDGQFNAVSTVETGELVSDAEYPAFAGMLYRVLRPGGRALVQQRSRVDAPGGAFLETVTGPDLHLQPLGTTVSLLGAAGLEVRDVQALREHYEWTLAAWSTTLERSWNGAVDRIGEVGARAWRLYLVGAALAFAENRMGVEQILAARPEASGAAQLDPAV